MAICKNGHRISMLVEGKPRLGFQTFSKVVATGTKGICISRLHPDYVSQKFGLERTTRYWLSDCRSKSSLSPRALDKITKAIRSSVAKEPSSVILLDGLEGLLVCHDLSKVVSFLREVDAVLSKSDSEMVICVDQPAFEAKDLEALFRIFPRCSPEEMSMTLARPQPQVSLVSVRSGMVQAVPSR